MRVDKRNFFWQDGLLCYVRDLLCSHGFQLMLELSVLTSLPAFRIAVHKSAGHLNKANI